MEIIFVLLVIFGIGSLINAGSSPETKLFRRIWSTERTMGSRSVIRDKQEEAVQALFDKYGVKTTATDEQLREAVVSLLAAAAKFDLDNPRNFGVEIAPVIGRYIRVRFRGVSDLWSDSLYD